MNYYQPNNLNAAFNILENNRETIIGAGFTDIYPVTEKSAFSKDILDITEISEIKGFSSQNNFTIIGATTTWSDIINEKLPRSFDLLKECGKEVGSVQIQNLGTVGGNLCTASPAGDSIPCLLAMDAKVKVKSKQNSRILKLDEFICGARKTSLKKGEILTSILIPKQKDIGFSSFKKIGARKYLIISISMAACHLEVENNYIKQISISVGSCSGVAKRIFSIEKQLINKRVGPNIFKNVDFSKLKELSPITDMRSTKFYRLMASKALIKEVVLNSLKKI